MVDSDPGTPGTAPEDQDVRHERTELAELARHAPDRIRDRLARLRLAAQARLALGLPPRERLEVLLHSPSPMRLVRSVPDAELYLLVREVGPADALPLLSLASASQIVHLLDLEAWRRDEFDAKRCGAWVALIVEAGEPVVRRLVRSADDELLALLFQRWARIVQIELDDTPDRAGHGETEAGTDAGFVSPDGYHRFRPAIPEHVPAVRRLAETFAADDADRYRRVIWSALWEPRLELEEQALHWRQSRLEEHGFPRWDEAAAVYAPPTGARVDPAPSGDTDDETRDASSVPLRLARVGGGLADALAELEGPARARVLHETLSLANHLLVADAADTGDPEAHRAALERAASYVNVALGARGAADGSAAGRFVDEIPMVELFREGFGLAAELAAQARRLLRDGWASRHPRALELLDPPVGPAVAGLLRPRPAYFDPRAGSGEAAYRDFRTPGEIEEARAAVRMAESLGHVFVDHLGLDLDAVLRENTERLHGVRFGTLLLTSMAWSAVERSLRCEPLPPELTAAFLRTVASHRTAGPDAPARALDDLVGRMAREVELRHDQVAAVRAFGRACLETLAEECSALDPGTPPDPRYVSCLLLEA